MKMSARKFDGNCNLNLIMKTETGDYIKTELILDSVDTHTQRLQKRIESPATKTVWQTRSWVFACIGLANNISRMKSYADFVTINEMAVTIRSVQFRSDQVSLSLSLSHMYFLNSDRSFWCNESVVDWCKCIDYIGLQEMSRRRNTGCPTCQPWAYSLV